MHRPDTRSSSAQVPRKPLGLTSSIASRHRKGEAVGEQGVSRHPSQGAASAPVRSQPAKAPRAVASTHLRALDGSSRLPLRAPSLPSLPVGGFSPPTEAAGEVPAGGLTPCRQ